MQMGVMIERQAEAVQTGDGVEPRSACRRHGSSPPQYKAAALL
jgi:hypothetical protein